MSDHVICTQCNAKFKFRPDLKGKRFKCSKCGHVLEMVRQPNARPQVVAVAESDPDMPSFDVTPTPKRSTTRSRYADRARKQTTAFDIGRNVMAVVGCILSALLLLGFVVGGSKDDGEKSVATTAPNVADPHTSSSTASVQPKRNDDRFFVECAKKLDLELFLTPEQVKSAMQQAATEIEPGRTIEPTLERPMKVRNKNLLIIRYGSDVFFGFAERVDVGGYGLGQVEIDGVKRTAVDLGTGSGEPSRNGGKEPDPHWKEGYDEGERMAWNIIRQIEEAPAAAQQSIAQRIVKPQIDALKTTWQGVDRVKGGDDPDAKYQAGRFAGFAGTIGREHPEWVGR